MRLYSIADIHCGNHQAHGGELVAGMNKRCRSIFDVLWQVHDLVKSDPEGTLLVCGDLIDVVRPEAAILAELQRVCDDIPVIIFKGNHESNSDAPGDNALGPLRPVATIVETDTVFEFDDLTLWCIPFRRAPGELWLRDAFKACSEQETRPAPVRVVGVHLGIADKKTAKFLVGAPDSISVDVLAKLCSVYDVAQVYAGNWHDHRAWDLFDTQRNASTRIVQIGALVPTGWNNPGLDGYGGVGVFTPGAATPSTFMEIDGPRFLKTMTDSDLADAISLSPAVRARVYLRAYVDPEQVSTVSDRVRALGFAATEVHAHAVYRQVAAKQAASKAASADNADASVERYVMAAPLPKGIDFDDAQDRNVAEKVYREGVLQITRDLLVDALTGADP